SVIHVEGAVDPLRDIETIQIELALSDLATAERRREKAQKNLKTGDKTARMELDVLDKLQPALEEGRSARTITLTEDERAVARNFFLLTTKPTIYAANVEEAALDKLGDNPMVNAVREVAAKEAAECVVICAQLEADLVALPIEERVDYLKSLNVSTSGVDQLIKSAYHLLGLMSFLTAGEKEVRAWTIPQGTRAQTAAGTIHSDIERGFIRAEIISYDDLIKAGSYAAAREKGLLRLEGKDYIMQEGDVVHFRFNV
ncbi:MAG TPA: redox-regulated ATPase YchF, partial [Pyrinomonadaceae bacterium]|nr:redox-regulated ATPase YchF [Pyrinomonadaceae bacterium]